MNVLKEWPAMFVNNRGKLKEAQNLSESCKIISLFVDVVGLVSFVDVK